LTQNASRCRKHADPFDDVIHVRRLHNNTGIPQARLLRCRTSRISWNSQGLMRAPRPTINAVQLLACHLQGSARKAHSDWDKPNVMTVGAGQVRSL
jgi:hypothetical protein